jgi:pyruvate ferredoxin oxidoreductase delta subunit
LKKYDIATTISYPVKGATGKTGNWRVFKPILDKSKCVKCLRCWIYCPEATIIRNKNDTIDIDYEYCKGCGICANVCKVKAIIMKRETIKNDKSND